MGIHFNVTNYSQVPIFDVHWFVRDGSGVSRNQLDPPSLAPGRVVEVVSNFGVNRAVLSGQFAGITFRDNAGLRWLKWGDGWLLRGEPSDLLELSPPDVVLADDPHADPRARAAALRSAR